MRMTKSRRTIIVFVMLERSEASKKVVLVITIVKEILHYVQDDKAARG